LLLLATVELVVRLLNNIIFAPEKKLFFSLRYG